MRDLVWLSADRNSLRNFVFVTSDFAVVNFCRCLASKVLSCDLFFEKLALGETGPLEPGFILRVVKAPPSERVD